MKIYQGVLKMRTGRELENTEVWEITVFLDKFSFLSQAEDDVL